MTLLPQLRDQLVAVPAAPPSRRRAARTLAPLVALGLLLAAGALAATGVIPIGSPIPTPPGLKPDPHRGGGAPVPSSARLLPLRVADPAGGPPWGLRIVTTSRGLTCVQAGRVVDGRLGVLGQDGVAGNDGRFHPLPLTTTAPGCAAPDGAGHAFIGISAAMAASGPALQPTCALGAERGAPVPACPAGDERRVMFGLLGPEATSISYRDGHRVRSQAVAAPDGGYLIVLAVHPRNAGWAIGTMPAVGYTIRRIDYRDGSSCRGRTDRHPARCPLVGYTPPAGTPAPSTIRRPLRIRGNGHRLDVSFRAPVAVRDARSFYTLTVQFSHGPHCHGAGIGTATDRNIATGAVVRMTASLQPNCHGPVTGTVAFVSSATASGPLPPAPGNPANPTVGRFTHNIP